jgi:hydroxyethylthiazole kinase-like uncharacterized protein yjeF
MHRILGSRRAWPLHGTANSRAIEQRALASTAEHVLMQRAGLAVAQLALAVAPYARRTWVVAGPGNNGGDGLEAAVHLHRAGHDVTVSLIGGLQTQPADARAALERAHGAGLRIEAGCPAQAPACDLVVDALLGLGSTRAPQGDFAHAVALINARGAPCLAVDLPTGLAADTGAVGDGAACVRAAHTLSLLTLKPGLFTAQGRDAVGEVWLDDLGVTPALEPDAWLTGAPAARGRTLQRRHAQHKGSFGDVVVVGGAPGMGGAAVLAARAALAAGAGRAYLAPLDEALSTVDATRPELMLRAHAWLAAPPWLAQRTVVCGCGGGDEVRSTLPPLLHHAAQLILDADALNALAGDEALRHALRARSARGLPSVLTPHPLEAARLLARPLAEVQADRLGAARRLAEAFGTVVVLKGSGSVVAAPAQAPHVNPTGNAALASPGTGDVLAGWIGGLWSASASTSAWTPGADATARNASAMAAALASVWWHGQAAEGVGHGPLRASDLIERMHALAAAD